ncbi:MAG: glycosyltransferase, partial [Anaerolineae bacterium]
VLTPSQEGQAHRRTHGDVQVQAIASLPLPFAAQARVTPLPRGAVRRALAQFRPQIVHVQDHYPLCHSSAEVAAERHLPLVGTNHFLPANIIDEVGPFQLAPGLVRTLLWKWVLATFRRADVVTTPTETAAAILRRTGLEAPIRAISNGVDVQRFRPDPGVDRRRMRQRYGLDPDRILLLYVGRLAEEKCLDVLLQALEQIQRNDVQVAIAGRGPYRPELEAEARELLPPQRAILTGFVPDEDLPALLDSADVFVMPSEAELQSIATLEAMASGLPVVASDAEALPELVEPGKNGYLFHSGDVQDAARALLKMLDRRSDWPAMGQASRAMAEAHDVQKTVDRYEALYLSLLGEQEAGPPGRSG